MMPKRAAVRILAAAVLACGIACGPMSGAEERKSAPAPGGIVIGILTAKTDADILVKPEGAQAPRRFLLAPPGGAPNPAVQAALKEIVVPNLVGLQWHMQDEPVVAAIHAILPRTKMGSAAGTVVAKGSNDKEPYIDLKSAGPGFTERYGPYSAGAAAPKGPGIDKDIVQTCGTLNVGDKVKLEWVCDERKRVVKLQVVAHAPAPKVTGKE